MVWKKHNTATMANKMSMEHWWMDNDRGKPKYSDKNCLSTSFPTINPGLQSNLGLSDKPPVTLATAWPRRPV
jgi:hypothetical protein